MEEIQKGGYSLGLYKKCCAPHMFGCPLYIHKTKKACFVRLWGCPYAPIHLNAPCMLGFPSYALMPPVC